MTDAFPPQGLKSGFERKFPFCYKTHRPKEILGQSFKSSFPYFCPRKETCGKCANCSRVYCLFVS